LFTSPLFPFQLHQVERIDVRFIDASFLQRLFGGGIVCAQPLCAVAPRALPRQKRRCDDLKLDIVVEILDSETGGVGLVRLAVKD